MKSKNVLIPLDLVNSSADALLFVQNMAAELPVSVTLLYVLNLNVVPMDGGMYDELYTESKAALGKLSKFFFGNDQCVHLDVRLGKPSEEIIAAAKAARSEIIVMSSPKPRRWTQFFGSTTVEMVVRNAPCPTLVLPRTWKIVTQERNAFQHTSESATFDREASAVWRPASTASTF